MLFIEFIGGVVRYCFFAIIGLLKNPKKDVKHSFFKKSSADLDNNAADTIVGVFFLIFVLVLVYFLS